MTYSVILLRLMGTEFATITLKSEHLQPEEKLWRGVLHNALDDTFTISSDRKSSINKTNAHNWIVNNADDFQQVCYWGGYDPDHVREKYCESYKTGKIKFNERQIAWAKYYKQYLIYKKCVDLESRKYHRKRLESLRNSVKDATTALISMVFVSCIA